VPPPWPPPFEAQAVASIGNYVGQCRETPADPRRAAMPAPHATIGCAPLNLARFAFTLGRLMVQCGLPGVEGKKIAQFMRRWSHD
jgi:hypothetical protein